MLGGFLIFLSDKCWSAQRVHSDSHGNIGLCTSGCWNLCSGSGTKVGNDANEIPVKCVSLLSFAYHKQQTLIGLHSCRSSLPQSRPDLERPAAHCGLDLRVRSFGQQPRLEEKRSRADGQQPFRIWPSQCQSPGGPCWPGHLEARAWEEAVYCKGWLLPAKVWKCPKACGFIIVCIACSDCALKGWPGNLITQSISCYCHFVSKNKEISPSVLLKTHLLLVFIFHFFQVLSLGMDFWVFFYDDSCATRW